MATLPTMDTTSLQLVEQGSTPATPAATKVRLFVRSSDHLLCTVDSSGAVTSWGGALTNPMTTAEDIIKGGTAGAPARLAKGAAGGALSIINAAVAWNSGTAFPGSVVAGDRYWRTDLGREYYYDGTRWLTVYEHTMHVHVANPVPASGSPSDQGAAVVPAQDIYITTWDALLYDAGTINGSNYWTMQLRSDGANNVGSSWNNSADTGSTYTKHTQTINAVVSGKKYLDILYTKTGAPGDMYGGADAHRISYRLIGT